MISKKWLALVVIKVTPWTVARQAPLSMDFSRQEYWSIAIPFSRESNLRLMSPVWQAGSLPVAPPGKTH